MFLNDFLWKKLFLKVFAIKKTNFITKVLKIRINQTGMSEIIRNLENIPQTTILKLRFRPSFQKKKLFRNFLSVFNQIYELKNFIHIYHNF